MRDGIADFGWRPRAISGGSEGARKVLIADAHLRRRRHTRAVLESTTPPGWAVVAEVSTEDTEEVLRLTLELRPEIVLVGLGVVEDEEIIVLCREIKDVPSPPRVVLYGTWEGGFVGSEEMALTFSLADAHVSGEIRPETLL